MLPAASMNMTELTVLTDTLEETSILFGSYDANIKPIERAFGVTILAKDTMAAAIRMRIITSLN